MCSMEEEQEFKQFAAQPDVQQRLFSKIAPQIFGHEDIKKAVACLLFGGARKVGQECQLVGCFMLASWAERHT